MWNLLLSLLYGVTLRQQNLITIKTILQKIRGVDRKSDGIGLNLDAAKLKWRVCRFVGDCRYHMGSPLTPEEVRRWGGKGVLQGVGFKKLKKRSTYTISFQL